MEEDYKSACILGRSCKLLVMVVKFVLTCKQGSLSFIPLFLSPTPPFFPPSFLSFDSLSKVVNSNQWKIKMTRTWSAVMPQTNGPFSLSEASDQIL